MPTQSSRRTPRTYKIRITADRVLGPLDLDRVKQLVMKGRVQGKEPTSVEPFNSWTPFASFPELSELLLKKLEVDADRKSGRADDPNALPATKTIVASERTKTMMMTEEPEPSVSRSLNEDYGMPTLLNIKMPEK
ncbi:MAG: hypothetical protein ACXVCI_22080, partial [Bdellovibrionota bacterium]